MTAPDQCCSYVRKFLPRRRPHVTLNVLLSFAQFEREVTSERIRDKITASKRKGLWVGGIGAARL